MQREGHGLKDGSQRGLKEGGSGRNRNPEPCAEGPGLKEGKIDKGK